MDAQPAMRQRNVTLLELLDRVLDKGVFISGDIVLSVAGVDLVALDVRALICSQDTFNRLKAQYEPPRLREPRDSAAS